MDERFFPETIKVLIVESNPRRSEQLKQVLEKSSMQTVQSYNGSEALKLMRIVRPDLIITAVGMPEMDGGELCRQVKKDPDLKHIPVIIMTAIDQVDEILKGVAAGADGHVIRPCHPQNLVSEIKQVLGNRKNLGVEEEVEPLRLIHNNNDYEITANGTSLLSMLFSIHSSVRVQSADLQEKKEELLHVSNLLKRKVGERNQELKVHLDKIRNASTEIRNTEKRYHELIENALAGIFRIDSEGVILQANQAFEEMTGWQLDMENPANAQDLFCKSDGWESFMGRLSGGETVEGFETCIRKGEEKMEVSVNAFMDGVEISCMMTDITEQKEEERKLKSMMDELINAKEKAAQSESVKTSFLANMSDRILQPVKALTIQADRIDQDELSRDQLEAHLNEIGEIGNYLSNLIDSTIDVAMIEADEAKIKFEDCYLNQMLIDIFARQQKMLEKKGVQNIELRLRREIKAPGYLIRSEGYRLKRIIENLLSSSLKYTTSGVIEFGYKVYSRTFGDDDVLLFYVKDTGTGMPEQKVRHIFDRFGAGGTGRKEDYHAAGLGLSLSRGYTEMLGGKIWCESEPEKGTEFYFTHPVDKTDEVLPLSYDSLISKDIKKITQGRKMLLSEHSDEHYGLLRRMIDPLTMTVDRATSGKELTDMLKAGKKYDLLIVDLKSSIVTGHELISEIRRLNNKVPVIVRSSFFSEEEVHMLREFGCQHLVSKPVDPKVLYTMIASVL